MAFSAAASSPTRTASMVAAPVTRATRSALHSKSSRKCSRFIAMCAIIATAKTAMAGTMMTTRSFRSMGSSANRRINSPPDHIAVLLPPVKCRLYQGNLLELARITTAAKRDEVHVCSSFAVRALTALGVCRTRRCGRCRADQAAGARPIEGRPGVGLAAGRNIAVADEALRREPGIGGTQRGHHFRQAIVLHVLVRLRIGPFEFHAHREIVA